MVPEPVAGAGPARLGALVRDRVLDPELAGLLWLLVEARLPVVVAGGPAACRDEVRGALADLLPADTRLVRLRGEDETFDWLPEAGELGWLEGGSRPSPTDLVSGSPRGSTVLLAELEDRPPDGTWGERARLVIRAVAIGYGLVATAGGERLEDVLGRLAALPVAAIDDELTRLGVVLVVSVTDPEHGGRCRVVAAHYLRPVQRDAHGHLQRMPPAVLTTWDPGAGRFEHFAWGVADELAGRTGRRVTDLEREQAGRAAFLARMTGGSATLRDTGSSGGDGW